MSYPLAAALALLLPMVVLAQPTRTAPSTATTTAQSPAAPAPHTTFDGPSLTVDFPGLRIGVAEYDEGPTGATVFYFPSGVMGAVDVRGGAPGTVNTDWLRLGYEDREMKAVIFSGSSWHGLATATGVADEIRASRTSADSSPPIVGVVAAIVNDLASGRRLSGVTADDRLGRAAVREAMRTATPGRFPLGAHGAGRFTMIGGFLGQLEPAGQGAAFKQLGPTRIAVFTVVNAGGFVVDRAGRIARCRSQHFGEPCSTIADVLARRVDRLAADSARGGSDDGAAPQSAEGGQSENTTITLVVTNQRLPWWALQRLAVHVHTSMARAIQPFSTAGDGDVLYAVSTREVDNPRLSLADLGMAASELAWDAVLSALPPLEPVGPTAPIAADPSTFDAYAGTYSLGPASRLTVSRDSARLVVTGERAGMYVPAATTVALIPVAPDEFLIDRPRRDRIRFVRGAGGAVTALTINPGHWAIPARRQPPSTGKDR